MMDRGLECDKRVRAMVQEIFVSLRNGNMRAMTDNRIVWVIYAMSAKEDMTIVMCFETCECVFCTKISICTF